MRQHPTPMAPPALRGTGWPYSTTTYDPTRRAARGDRRTPDTELDFREYESDPDKRMPRESVTDIIVPTETSADVWYAEIVARREEREKPEWVKLKREHLDRERARSKPDAPSVPTAPPVTSDSKGMGLGGIAQNETGQAGDGEHSLGAHPDTKTDPEPEVSPQPAPPTTLTATELGATFPADFPRYTTVSRMAETAAYLANTDYVISLAGSPLNDLKYGIIVVPVGEESLLFGGGQT